MNKIFKVIWNHATQSFVVVSELTRTKGKSSSTTDERISPAKTLLALGIAGISIGTTAEAASVVIGSTSGSSLYAATASASANDAVAVGYNSTALNNNTIALGAKAKATGAESTAVGYAAKATKQNASAFGHGAIASGVSALAVGVGAMATEDSAVAIGNDSNATAQSAVAVGESSNATANYSTAIGDSSTASGVRSSALGIDANATGKSSVAVGDLSIASNFRANAVGWKADARGKNANAIGSNARAFNHNTIAVGTNAIAGGASAVAIGLDSVACGVSSAALGHAAKACVDRSVAAGYNAKTTVVDSVALGSNATTRAAVNTSSATVNGVSYTGFAGDKAVSVVSVGSMGAERQIQNVAAGQITANSTDAINGSQLYVVANNLTNNINIANNTANIAYETVNKGWNLTTSQSGTGSATGKSISNIQMGGLVTIEAGDNINITQKQNNVTIATSNKPTFNSVTVNSVTANSVATNNLVTTNFTVNAGGVVNMGGNVVTNIAAPVNSTDAVNKYYVDNGRTKITSDNNSVNVAYNASTNTYDLSVTASNNNNNAAGNITLVNSNTTTVTKNGTNYSVEVNKSPVTVNATTGKVETSVNTVVANNSFATVNDIVTVLNNVSWTIQGNGAVADQVKAGDVVNFVNGNGTTAEVVSRGNTTNVSYNVNTTNMAYNTTTHTIEVGNNTSYVTAGEIAKTITDSELTSSVIVGNDNLIVTDTKTGNNTEYNVTLNNTLNLTKDGSVIIGNTTVNNNGVTIVNGPSITQNGIDAGNKTITNVRAGVNSTDAVNVAQLTNVSNNVTNITNEVAKGWNITTSKSGTGSVTGTSTANVQMGGLVKIEAGDNINITQEQSNITIATSNRPTFNSVTANSVATNNFVTTNFTVNAGGIVNMGGNVITNVAAPVNSTDAVNKYYVDNGRTKITSDNNSVNVAYNASTNTYDLSVTANNNSGDITLVNGNTTTVTKNGTNYSVEVNQSPVTVNATTGKAETSTDATVANNSFATVNDVITALNNVSWTIRGNGVVADQIAAGDSVNFVNGNGTTTVVTSDGSTTNVAFNVNTTTMAYNATTGVINVGNNNSFATAGDVAKAITDSELTSSVISGNSNLVVINTTTGNNTEYNVTLNNNLNLSNTGSVSIGNTTVNNNGVTINGGPSITQVGINAGNTTIINVADGVNGTDAVNVNQLNNVSNNITNITNEVAKGWNLATAASSGSVTGSTIEQINAGETVTFDAGKNINLTQSGNSITIETTDMPTFTNVTVGNTQITNEGLIINNGPSITNNGINAGNTVITNVAAGVNATDAVNVSQLNQTVSASKTELANGSTTTVNSTMGANNQTIYTVEVNKSPVTVNSTTGTAETTADATTANNSFASVNDVVNALNNVSWTIQGNGADVDQVKAGDAVNFVNGDGTTANVTTNADGNVTNVTFNVNSTNMTYNATTGNIDVGDNSSFANAGDVAKAITDSELTSSVVSGNNNLVVTNTTTGNNTEYNVTLSNNLNLTDAGSVAIGNTTLNDDGLTINGGPSVTKAGINAGNATITNVAAGVNATDAVNVSQLNASTAAARTELANGSTTTVNSTIGANNQTIYTVEVNKSPVTVNSTTGTAETTTDSVAANNSFASVGDVVNALNNVSWAIQGNGVTADQVKAGDTVNFVNGNGTTANVTTNADGNVTNVTFNVNTTNMTYNASTGNINVGDNDSFANAGDVAKAITDSELTSSVVSGNNNLVVTNTTTGNNTEYNVTLSNNLNLTEAGSVAIGNTTLNDNGLTINGGPSVTKAGINAGNATITNVAAGVNATDAVNLAQLNASRSVVTSANNTITVTNTSDVNGTVYNVEVNKSPVIVNTTTGVAETTATGDVANNSFASVGDVVNALNNVSWTIQGNGVDVDQVTAGNKVNFVNGNGTTASLTSDVANGTTNVTFNVNTTTATITDGKASVADGDSFLNATTVTNIVNNVSWTVGSGTVTGSNGVSEYVVSEESRIAAGDILNYNAGQNIVIGGEGSNITIATNPNSTFDSVAVNNQVTVGNVTIASNGSISGVADGDIAPDSTQAINGSQLYAANQNVANYLGGGSTVDANGNVTAPNYVITGTDGTTTTANNVGDALSNLNAEVIKPLTFAGDTGASSPRTLGSTVTVKGGVSDESKLSDNNIGVVSDGNGTLTVKLAKDINVDSVTAKTVTADTVNTNTVKAGDTTINSDGVTIAGGPSVTKSGIDAGGQKITNVKAGEADTDAVNVAQLKEATGNMTNNISNKINKVDKDLRAGIAGANAAVGLPQVYEGGKSMVAAAAGTYKGESAVAVGYSRASDNGKVILKLQGNANSRGDFGGSVGVGYQW